MNPATQTHPPVTGAASQTLSDAVRADLAQRRPLLEQLPGLKRVRTGDTGRRSLVDRAFARGWCRLLAGESAEAVAWSEAAAFRRGAVGGSGCGDHGRLRAE